MKAETHWQGPGLRAGDLEGRSSCLRQMEKKQFRTEVSSGERGDCSQLELATPPFPFCLIQLWRERRLLYEPAALSWS